MNELTANQTQYAKHIGRTRQYVNKLVGQGKIQLTDDGLIDVAKADFDLKRHKDPAREMSLPLEDSETPDGDKDSYATARAERERYQARLSKLEYEERTGLLVRRRDAEEAMVSGARRIREGHQLIPTWSNELYSMIKEGDASPDEVRNFLKTKVRDMDQLIANNLDLMAKGAADE